MAGTPMSWWWDSYINPRNLYPLYGAFNRWIEGFDFVEQNPKKIEAAIADETTLRCYGLLGKTRGLIWIQNPHHTWSNAAKPDLKPSPTKPTTLIIKDLPGGKWTIETFDPQAGKTIKSQPVTVAADQTLKIPLPEIQWDAAYRLHR